MKHRVLLISMLGLAGLMEPARATMSFYLGAGASGNYDSAVLLAGLSPNGPYSFSGVNLETNVATNDEYADPVSGVNFFAFANSGGNPGAASSFTVSSAHLIASNQAFIEIALPANVFAFGFNITVPSGFGIFCGSVGSPNCDNQFVVTSSSDTEFFGVVSSTAISTVWISANSGIPDLVNFEDATGTTTPEVRTALLLGAGLVVLGFLKRGMRQRGVVRSAQY